MCTILQSATRFRRSAAPCSVLFASRALRGRGRGYLHTSSVETSVSRSSFTLRKKDEHDTANKWMPSGEFLGQLKNAPAIQSHSAVCAQSKTSAVPDQVLKLIAPVSLRPRSTRLPSLLRSSAFTLGSAGVPEERDQTKMAFLQAPLPCAPHRAVAHVPLSMTVSPPPTQQQPSAAKRFSRRVVLAALASAAGSLVAAEVSTAEEPSKLEYSVVKKGDGPSPVVGDLVGIRFKGMYNGIVFDNLFGDSRPYFYRTGSGAILKVRRNALVPA